MRFRTRAAIAASAAWRLSVRERSAPPITRLMREISAVSLGTALERGGTTTAAPECRTATSS